MEEFSNLSRNCATALLDAYSRSDEPRISQIAVEAQVISSFKGTDAAESERMEVLASIASALVRAPNGGHEENVDTYVRLLLHLARPDLIESVFENRN
jgi:hypothetical protein